MGFLTLVPKLWLRHVLNIVSIILSFNELTTFIFVGKQVHQGENSNSPVLKVFSPVIQCFPKLGFPWAIQCFLGLGFLWVIHSSPTEETRERTWEWGERDPRTNNSSPFWDFPSSLGPWFPWFSSSLPETRWPRINHHLRTYNWMVIVHTKLQLLEALATNNHNNNKYGGRNNSGGELPNWRNLRALLFEVLGGWGCSQLWRKLNVKKGD